MTIIKLKVITGEVVEFVVIHKDEIGLENNSLMAPGSGEHSIDVYTGIVEGVIRTLLIEEGMTSGYLIHKTPFDVDIVE